MQKWVRNKVANIDPILKSPGHYVWGHVTPCRAQPPVRNCAGIIREELDLPLSRSCRRRSLQGEHNLGSPGTGDKRIPHFLVAL